MAGKEEDLVVHERLRTRRIESIKRKSTLLNKSRVQLLKMIITAGSYLARVKTSRASTVPYVVKTDRLGREKVYFLFARDRRSRDITDLGGGVKKNEFALYAGLRELSEETNEIFGRLHERPNDFSNCLGLLGRWESNGFASVLFIPVSEKWLERAPQSFATKKRSSRKSHNEVSELVWLEERELSLLLRSRNGEMWSRVQKFYQEGYNDDLSESLRLWYNRR